MEEFAQVSGISRPTVSKYFYDPDSVRRSTRAKIEAALAEYEYRPNMFAINQNRKLTKNVGIVVPYLVDPFFAELARAIEQRCIDAGFRPTLFSAHGSADLEIEILDALRSLKPAGVLFAPLGRNSDRGVVEKFCRDVPTVLFDSNIDPLGVGFIGSDNTKISRMIVEYLCQSGSPPCFFEVKTPANPNADKRRLGYITAMEAMGQTPMIFQAEGAGWDFEEIGRVEGVRALCERRFETDTVLCSNDRLAIGLLAACYEKGLRVGRDAGCAIRVAGQDDHPFSRFTCPALTTIAQDYQAISNATVDALLQVIDGVELPYFNHLFEGRLVKRASA